MLPVGSLSYPAKAVALYHTLEAFPLGGCRNINILAFVEKVNPDGIPQFVFPFKIFEFNDLFLGRSACFLKMAGFGFFRTLFCLVIETKLKGLVPVYLFGSDLGNHAWPRLDNGTWNVFSILVKDAGHANFLSN